MAESRNFDNGRRKLREHTLIWDDSTQFIYSVRRCLTCQKIILVRWTALSASTTNDLCCIRCHDEIKGKSK